MMSTKTSLLLLVLLPLCRGARYNGTSTKKGLSVAPRTFMCGDVEAFSGISWYYNWGQHPNDLDHSEFGESPPDFVPMIWS